MSLKTRRHLLFMTQIKAIKTPSEEIPQIRKLKRLRHLMLKGDLDHGIALSVKKLLSLKMKLNRM
jgi:hypothetical protein